MRIAIVTNIAWNLFNFRKELARDLIEEGHEVVLMASADSYQEKLESLGFSFVELYNLERTGRNPFRDINLLLEFRRVFEREKVDFAILYHAKPMIYGAIAAKILGIPFIATITGLAGPFSGNRWLTRMIVTKMYKFSLSNSRMVFFQNDEDLNFLLGKKVVRKDVIKRIYGSGIDLSKFDCCQEKGRGSDQLVFFLFARLSYLKGIDLYAKAAASVKEKYPDVKFWLAGPFEEDEHAVPKQEIESWENKGWIEYLGVSDYIQKEIREADVVVYPSFYREGAPRALIESSAMCKPIITTDNVGCRDVVVHEETGLLIEPRSSKALEVAILKMIVMERKERIAMGRRGRERVKSYFSHKIVNESYLEILRSS